MLFEDFEWDKIKDKLFIWTQIRWLYEVQFIGEQTDDAKSAATGAEADSALGPVDLTRISEIETHDSEKIGKAPCPTLCLHMKIGLIDPIKKGWQKGIRGSIWAETH